MQRSGVPFPRAPLLAAGALVAFSLIVVAGARLSGFDPAPLPPSPSIETREIRFEDKDDGGITVRDANTSAVVAEIARETNGFLRVVMRGMAQVRKSRGLGPDVPFRLTRLADGRLVIEDPATGRSVGLNAFGPDNARAFARFLETTGGNS